MTLSIEDKQQTGDECQAWGTMIVIICPNI